MHANENNYYRLRSLSVHAVRMHDGARCKRTKGEKDEVASVSQIIRDGRLRVCVFITAVPITAGVLGRTGSRVRNYALALQQLIPSSSS